MSPTNLEKLRNYLPFWEYYKANKCIPPINLPTLETIASVYREELHPAPVRLYCSVCVEEMITTLFNQYEREILNQIKQKEPHETKDPSETQSLLPTGNQKESQHQNTSPKKRGRKVRRRRRRSKLG